MRRHRAGDVRVADRVPVERDVERAVRAGKITINESRQFMRFYEDGLDGYTYLEEY